MVRWVVMLGLLVSVSACNDFNPFKRGSSGNSRDAAAASGDGVVANPLPENPQQAAELTVDVAKNIPTNLDLAGPNGLPVSTNTQVVVVTPPENGTVTPVAGAQVVYQPNQGFVGGDSFSYLVAGKNVPGTVFVEVGNTAPVGVDETLTMLRGATLLHQLKADDADAGEVLQFTVMAGPSHGVLETITLDGQMTYKPDLDFAGTDTMTFAVSDGFASSDFVLTVVVTNEAPILGPVTQIEMYKNQTISVVFSSSDLEGDALAYQLTQQLGNGQVTIDESQPGRMTITPDRDFVGDDRFRFQVSDGIAAAPEHEVLVRVVNRAPRIVSKPRLDHHFRVEGGGPMKLPVILRDFKASHPDMQRGEIGLQEGLVKKTLGKDGLPVFANPDRPRRSVQDADSFRQWFRDIAGVNSRYDTTITLKKTPKGTLKYKNNHFFPLNNKLFGNEGRKNNYHFTLQTGGVFTYQGNEQFTFRGDDDLWLYINGHLVIDIGGVHPAVKRTVTLADKEDKLGLVVGQTYTVDLFFAERQTSHSVFRIETGMQLREKAPYVYHVQAEDLDGDALHYALTEAPDGMVIDANGVITWHMGEDDLGVHAVTVTVEDTSGATGSQSFNLSVLELQ